MVSWQGLNTLFAGAHAPSTTRGRRGARSSKFYALNCSVCLEYRYNFNPGFRAICQYSRRVPGSEPELMAQVNLFDQFVGQDGLGVSFGDQPAIIDDIGGFANIQGLTHVVVGD